MKKKLLRKTVKWTYEDRVVIHTMVKQLPDNPKYFSRGENDITSWENDSSWIDIEKTPKPKFISRFKNRIKGFWNY